MQNRFSARARRALSALLVVAACSVAPTVVAQDNLVGKDAPDFTVGESVNEALAQSLEDTQGEVVLIKFWGIN